MQFFSFVKAIRKVRGTNCIQVAFQEGFKRSDAHGITEWKMERYLLPGRKLNISHFTDEAIKSQRG